MPAGQWERGEALPLFVRPQIPIRVGEAESSLRPVEAWHTLIENGQCADTVRSCNDLVTAVPTWPGPQIFLNWTKLPREFRVYTVNAGGCPA